LNAYNVFFSGTFFRTTVSPSQFYNITRINSVQYTKLQKPIFYDVLCPFEEHPVRRSERAWYDL